MREELQALPGISALSHTLLLKHTLDTLQCVLHSGLGWHHMIPSLHFAFVALIDPSSQLLDSKVISFLSPEALKQ